MTDYSIMFFSAITPLHNGAGTGLGLIDNPVMRECATQIPIVQSSSIKGVLRDEFEDKTPAGVTEWDSRVKAVFGPSPGSGSDYAGALSLGDGRLLAFPVRSLKGCFVWATSPLTLHRFYRDLDIAGKLTGDLEQKFNALLPALESSLSSVLVCPSGVDLLLAGSRPDAGQTDTRKLILEEFPKQISQNQQLEDVAGKISDLVYSSPGAGFHKTEFAKKLVVLPEDSFVYFVRNATEVVPNIRIGRDGTTEDGSLRYTEYLPSESIFYSLVSFQKARSPKAVEFDLDTASKVKGFFNNYKPAPFIIQIGGDETLGKGIVQMTMY